jgi:hypothetical protein
VFCRKKKRLGQEISNRDSEYKLNQCEKKHKNNKQNKDQPKQNKHKKQKTNTNKPKKCERWQSCWLKENQYDPHSDVHNIYYNFHKSCSTALQTDCDKNAPVYSVPPPAGF